MINNTIYVIFLLIFAVQVFPQAADFFAFSLRKNPGKGGEGAAGKTAAEIAAEQERNRKTGFQSGKIWNEATGRFVFQVVFYILDAEKTEVIGFSLKGEEFGNEKECSERRASL